MFALAGSLKYVAMVPLSTPRVPVQWVVEGLIPVIKGISHQQLSSEKIRSWRQRGEGTFDIEFTYPDRILKAVLFHTYRASVAAFSQFHSDEE